MLKEIFLFLLLVGFPYMLQLGVLKGAPFRPKRRTGDKIIDGFVSKYIVHMMLFNGLMFAIFNVLFHHVSGYWWVAPLVISIPTVIAQLGFAGIAAGSYALEEGRKARRIRRSRLK